MFNESLILCKYGIILLSLTLKENTTGLHIVKIPKNQGANSYNLKLSKIGNWGLQIQLYKLLPSEAFEMFVEMQER